MTKKRFEKLTRAYFTRLYEFGKAKGEHLEISTIYRQLPKLASGCGMTRAEWWDKLSSIGYTFDVGMKGGN